MRRVSYKQNLRISQDIKRRQLKAVAKAQRNLSLMENPMPMLRTWYLGPSCGIRLAPCIAIKGAEAFLKALLNNINKPQSPGFHVLGLVTCCCNQADTLPAALPSAFIEDSAATKPTVFVEVSNKKAAQFKTSKNRQEDPMRIARKRESDRTLD